MINKQISERYERLGLIMKWIGEDRELGEMVQSAFMAKAEHRPAPTPPPMPATQLPPLTPRATNGHQTKKHTGFRARALRYLYTGPVRPEELRRVLGEDACKEGLYNLINRGDVIADPVTGVLRLSEPAKEDAAWFVANPNAAKIDHRPAYRVNPENLT